ncbi:hypothetical protein DPMN_078536 [Dreissena polymorpha]|uniref:Uncharacterized protein n=1 Tax=Dreissena polymorpha TaxID=45954 RepID=A0A9D3YME4_DREPO|nr:hypothetical protein DPMN_078536 [Dreissena polymorpha]
MASMRFSVCRMVSSVSRTAFTNSTSPSWAPPEPSMSTTTCTVTLRGCCRVTTAPCSSRSARTETSSSSPSWARSSWIRRSLKTRLNCRQLRCACIENKECGAKQFLLAKNCVYC